MVRTFSGRLGRSACTSRRCSAWRTSRSGLRIYLAFRCQRAAPPGPGAPPLHAARPSDAARRRERGGRRRGFHGAAARAVQSAAPQRNRLEGVRRCNTTGVCSVRCRERRIQRRIVFSGQAVGPVYRKARHEAEIGLRFAGLDELVDLKGDVNSSVSDTAKRQFIGRYTFAQRDRTRTHCGLLVSSTPVQAGPILDSALRHAKEIRLLTVAAQPAAQPSCAAAASRAPRTADSGRARSAGSPAASSCQ